MEAHPPWRVGEWRPPIGGRRASPPSGWPSMASVRPFWWCLIISSDYNQIMINRRRAGAWGGKEITKQVLNSKVIVNNKWWGSDWLGYANCPSSQSCLQSRLKTWETTYRMHVHSFKKLYIRESEHQAGKIFPLFFLFANTNCLVRRHVWSLIMYQLCNDSNILQASSQKKI